MKQETLVIDEKNDIDSFIDTTKWDEFGIRSYGAFSADIPDDPELIKFWEEFKKSSPE